MIKAGIIGITGYAGAELMRILSAHPEVKVVYAGSKSYAGQNYADIYSNFRGVFEETLKAEDLAEAAEEADVIFTATPQGYLASVINEDILSRAKIIDLSADFRIKDVSVYEKWYQLKHQAPELIKDAVYGLCELYREEIKKTRLLANPGCYTTCSILATYPLVKEGIIDPDTLVIDAKSGTSGAGRGAKTQNLFCEVNESIKAYAVGTHRHTPEIEQELSKAAGSEIRLSFVPHLVPMNRGILVTAYAKVKTQKNPTYQEIKDIYNNYYRDSKFIRLLPEGVNPETRWVHGSNFTDLNVVMDERTGRILMLGALDNLVKGAAGQAVQNMNLMFGLPEEMGLDLVPSFP